MTLKSSATRRACICILAVALAGLPLAAQADASRACGGVDYNAMILRIIKGLPAGGGYSINAATFQAPTVTANNIGGGRWEMRVYDGQPSHCASASYTVFAHLVATLHNSGTIRLSPDQLNAFRVLRTMPDGTARVDGEGPFWIFNANGAGVAAFLKHTSTGFNFRDDKLAYARPGDFLKIFWNGNVGASESGHQVIFTGRRQVAGRDMVCFWSSQRQNRKRRDGHTEALYFPATNSAAVHEGYGEVCRPRSDIKAMVFSRVTCMEHLAAGLDDMAAKSAASGGRPALFVDQYLRSIREELSNQATLDRMYAIVPAPAAAFADVGIGPLP